MPACTPLDTCRAPHTIAQQKGKQIKNNNINKKAEQIKTIRTIGQNISETTIKQKGETNQKQQNKKAEQIKNNNKTKRATNQNSINKRQSKSNKKAKRINKITWSALVRSGEGSRDA